MNLAHLPRATSDLKSFHCEYKFVIYCSKISVRVSFNEDPRISRAEHKHRLIVLDVYVDRICNKRIVFRFIAFLGKVIYLYATHYLTRSIIRR